MSVAALSDWPWRHWRRQRPQATAWVVDGQAHNWETLCQAIDARAAVFQQQGLVPGDGVALRGRNSAELVLAMGRAGMIGYFGAGGLPVVPALAVSSFIVPAFMPPSRTPGRRCCRQSRTR